MKNKLRYLVHKWIDIGYEDVPASLIPKLDCVMIYKDRLESCNENLYSIHSALEEFESQGIPYNEEEKEFIDKVIKYQEKEDAVYFRIVYS